MSLSEFDNWHGLPKSAIGKGVVNSNAAAMFGEGLLASV